MLASQRQALIRDMVRAHGSVRVTDLVRELDVSAMTIRRDLDHLAQEGTVQKVHGGATLPGRSTTDEPGFESKLVRDLAEKEAIAALAATLVRPGSAIGLSAGTTTWTLAHRLLGVDGITVVTNSVRVAEVFDGQPGERTVVLTGGVRTPSDALVGPVAVGSLRHINLDVVFLGTHGMDAHRGFTSPNLLEADMNRSLVASAQRVAVVADHSKWGLVGMGTFAALEDVDVLVTDDGLPAAALESLEAAVDEVLVATTLPLGGQVAAAPRPAV
ncbi:DeoR/GlpR family DNA-binding transcription regulator [Actinotalea fermentans]|uniref:DeoR family transcriptional regulator n=1 Tax=Actinotalea fermentans TaxID=43671 RepID=A0A511YT26_9CELL|nr:DeoR/GlpR family DNA-binding transcription regulator [Actinotalea fermentans]KGM17624.1 cytochrome C [Actinotalea fermentans ATCC 43279 = JCM 9966 = DSM 3133]GEN78351.1 DeoR family transcriptional regulator [Actinotalea fermentans]